MWPELPWWKPWLWQCWRELLRCRILLVSWHCLHLHQGSQDWTEARGSREGLHSAAGASWYWSRWVGGLSLMPPEPEIELTEDTLNTCSPSSTSWSIQFWKIIFVLYLFVSYKYKVDSFHVYSLSIECNKVILLMDQHHLKRWSR